MDKRFIKENSFFKSKNGIEIWSRWIPELHSDTKIYLRGTDIKDDLKVSSVMCDSNEKAYMMKQKIIIALKDWAENWVGFEEDKKVDVIVDDKQIFEF